MKIHLNIERLVLQGIDLDPAQRHLLQSSLETELSRLLDTNDMAATLAVGGALAQLKAEAIRIVAGAGPAGLGRQIAGSVIGSLSRPAGDRQLPAASPTT